MSSCQICKGESPEGERVCSPRCEDALEDLKIQRNWAAIQYSEALDELQGFEQDTYGKLYLVWDRICSQTNLIRAGMQRLSQSPLPSAPTLSPAEIKDGVKEPSAKLLEAKRREHKEWEEAQQETSAADVRFGKRMLQQLERRLNKIGRQLSDIGQRNPSNELGSFEQDSYGRLDSEWERLCSLTNLIRAGVQKLSQGTLPSDPALSPAEIKDGIKEPSAKLLEAKRREHKEWQEAQRETNAADVTFGTQRLEQLKKRYKRIDRRLSAMERKHDILGHKTVGFERDFLALKKQIGD